jgi:hypothetical protein
MELTKELTIEELFAERKQKSDRLNGHMLKLINIIDDLYETFEMSKLKAHRKILQDTYDEYTNSNDVMKVLSLGLRVELLENTLKALEIYKDALKRLSN